MGQAGKLVVSLVADSSQFVGGVKAAGAQLDEFGNKIKHTNTHSESFHGHMHNAASAVKTFSTGVGASVGEMSHLVHAFELAPGPIGLAIAAVLSLKMALESQAESAKKAGEAIREGYKISHDAFLYLNDLKDSDSQKQVDKLNDFIASERKKIIEAQHSIGGQLRWTFGVDEDKESKEHRKNILDAEKYRNHIQEKMNDLGDSGEIPAGEMGSHVGHAESASMLNTNVNSNDQIISLLSQINEKLGVTNFKAPGSYFETSVTATQPGRGSNVAATGTASQPGRSANVPSTGTASPVRTSGRGGRGGGM